MFMASSSDRKVASASNRLVHCQQTLTESAGHQQGHGVGKQPEGPRCHLRCPVISRATSSASKWKVQGVTERSAGPTASKREVHNVRKQSPRPQWHQANDSRCASSANIRRFYNVLNKSVF